MYYTFLLDFFHQYSVEWEGPFLKKWGNEYMNLCEEFKVFKVQAVQECKQICKNESGCNVLTFRSRSKICDLKKCPTPVRTPDKIRSENLHGKRIAYFLPGKQFNYTNLALFV